MSDYASPAFLCFAPSPLIPPEVLVARFWSRVDKSGACWVWTGAKNEHGYGVFGTGQHRRVHRISYILANGQIPPGLEIDHLCGVRACVNPDHLEAVTGAENLRRSRAPLKRIACSHGDVLPAETKDTSSPKCARCGAAAGRRDGWDSGDPRAELFELARRDYAARVRFLSTPPPPAQPTECPCRACADGYSPDAAPSNQPR